MRKLLVALVLIVVLGVVADVGARAYAERRVREEMSRSLDLSEEPDVSLGGFPFLLHLLRGTLPSVDVVASDVPAGRLRFDIVRMNLHDVSFSFADLLSRSGTVRADRADGTATVTPGDVMAALRDSGIPLSVEFSDGVIRITAAQLPGEVEASVKLEGQRLLFSPSRPALPLEFALDLPRFVPGMVYTDARIEGSVGVLTFRADQPTFDVNTAS